MGSDDHNKDPSSSTDTSSNTHTLDETRKAFTGSGPSNTHPDPSVKIPTDCEWDTTKSALARFKAFNDSANEATWCLGVASSIADGVPAFSGMGERKNLFSNIDIEKSESEIFLDLEKLNKHLDDAVESHLQRDPERCSAIQTYQKVYKLALEKMNNAGAASLPGDIRLSASSGTDMTLDQFIRAARAFERTTFKRMEKHVTFSNNESVSKRSTAKSRFSQTHEEGSGMSENTALSNVSRTALLLLGTSSCLTLAHQGWKWWHNK